LREVEEYQYKDQDCIEFICQQRLLLEYKDLTLTFVITCPRITEFPEDAAKAASQDIYLHVQIIHQTYIWKIAFLLRKHFQRPCYIVFVGGQQKLF
jgi:hypothetical protein